MLQFPTFNLVCPKFKVKSDNGIFQELLYLISFHAIKALEMRRSSPDVLFLSDSKENATKITYSWLRAKRSIKIPFFDTWPIFYEYYEYEFILCNNISIIYYLIGKKKSAKIECRENF